MYRNYASTKLASSNFLTAFDINQYEEKQLHDSPSLSSKLIIHHFKIVFFLVHCSSAFYYDAIILKAMKLSLFLSS